MHSIFFFTHEAEQIDALALEVLERDIYTDGSLELTPVDDYYWDIDLWLELNGFVEERVIASGRVLFIHAYNLLLKEKQDAEIQRLFNVDAA